MPLKLEGIKAGDKVIHKCHLDWRILTVDKVSKAQGGTIHVGTSRFDMNGYRRGAGTWERISTRIFPESDPEAVEGLTIQAAQERLCDAQKDMLNLGARTSAYRDAALMDALSEKLETILKEHQK